MGGLEDTRESGGGPANRAGHARRGVDGGRSSAAPHTYVLSRGAARELDRECVERYGLPTIVLMENAARGVCAACIEMLGGVPDPRAVVVCGPGNNGGDGLAAARHLHNAGVEVVVILGAAIPEANGALLSDAGVHLSVARAMGLKVTEAWLHGGVLALRSAGEGASLVVDALLGTGLSRSVGGEFAELIVEMNRLAGWSSDAQRRGSGIPILAVDIPSGLDADSGCPLGAAVRATRTVALGGLKQGMLAMDAQGYVGEVSVVEIGVPVELVARLGSRLTGGTPEHWRRVADESQVRSEAAFQGRSALARHGEAV